MTQIKAGFRHELKYLITYPEAALIRSRISELMEKDSHVEQNGDYTIRSLYFDDYFNSAYKEKEAGIFARKKYRIRIYNYSDRFISFERKTKNDAYIYKEAIQLTREECDRILLGDYKFLERKENRFAKELYFELTARLLRPRVMVDYEREPYICRAGNVRVTFDKQVRGSGCFDLFDPKIPSFMTLPPEKLIMEVKFDSFLPDYIRRAITPKRLEYCAVSKFVLCCDVCPRDNDQLGWKARMKLHQLTDISSFERTRQEQVL